MDGLPSSPTAVMKAEDKMEEVEKKEEEEEKEEEGRGRLGMVDERKETRGQDDGTGRGGPALRADGASWDQC